MAVRRTEENRLLRQAIVLLALLYAALAIGRSASGQTPVRMPELAALLLFAAGWLMVHEALALMGIRGEPTVVPAVAVLTGLGLVLKLRLAASPLAWDGLVALAPYPLGMAALVAVVWVCRRRLDWVYRATWPCGLGACVLLALLLHRGVHYRGGVYGPHLTTPTEALKLLLVVFLAGFLRQRRTLPELLSFAVLWIGAMGLLVRQSDLGMIVILSCLLLSLFYVATGRSRFLLGGLGGAALVGVALYYAAPLGMAAGPRQQRIVTWINPWQQPQGAGYQTLQALFALRAGGWEGRGLGAGTPHATPLVSSDFVYAAIAEELGLVGCAVVLALFLSLFRSGYRIATATSDPFKQRLAVGCVTVLAIQTLLNIGGVVRLLPITGITLPFVSHGGSSVVVSFALVGLLLAVGHDVETGAPPPRRVRRAAVPEEDLPPLDASGRPVSPPGPPPRGPRA